jgi:transcriptional/translational regulatory protein YebC/TACO1
VYQRAANGANQVCSPGHCHYQHSLHKIGVHVLVERLADNQARSTQSRHDLTEQTNENRQESVVCEDKSDARSGGIA